MTPYVSSRDLVIVQRILRQYAPPEAVIWVFGSRATGTIKRGSDLDLAIDAKRPLRQEERCNLSEAFDESDLPYKVDIIDLQTVSDTFRFYIEKDRILLDWKT